MRRLFVLTSKVTGLTKQVYAENELHAISLMQNRKGFRLGEFTIRTVARRQMRS